MIAYGSVAVHATDTVSNSRQSEQSPFILAPATPRNPPRGHHSPELQQREYLLIRARRDAVLRAEGLDQGKPLPVLVNLQE